MKVKIFIDFWNLQLSWNEYHSRSGSSTPVRIPWEGTLPQVLLSRVGKDSEYAGTHVYASINPKAQRIEDSILFSSKWIYFKDIR